MLQKNHNRLISNFNRSIPAWGRHITPAPCQPGHSLKLPAFAENHNGIPVHPETVSEARLLLVKHGLIGRGKQRERRPTSDELDRLLAHFRKRMAHHSSLIPMADIVEFAVYSAMRQGEITRILWADVDENRQTVIIRDRKSPTQKQGNDQTIPLLGPAWEILQRQPRLDPRCFPFDERSISAAFTRTCQQLGIDNLRFHDLRREGASRLIERGFTLAEVAAVTGHRSINILHQVYTKIKPETLHERYKKNRTPK